MEKRACERLNHTALIAFSYFNQKPYFDTQTLNHCIGGMCFKSSFFLQPGASLCIRVKKFNPNGSCTGLSEGLRSVTLAEVKWCDRVLDADAFAFEVGVKYYEQVY